MLSRSLFAFALVAIVGLPSVYAAGADLSVSIASPVATIRKGDVLTYTVKAFNNGPAVANSFTLSDEVPAGLTFDSATTGCTLVGTTVTCSSTTKMYAGGARSFALKFKTDSATCGANITNVATVSSPDDTNVENNTSNTVSTQIICPDLSVSIATPVAKVRKGDLLTYTVKVLNNGPALAKSFTLLDEVPAGLTFDSSPSGCTLVGTTVTCPSTAIMYKGGVKSFALKFKTDSATCDANITNVATVSSSEDPNSTNNTSNTVSTQIICPDLSVSIAAPVATILKGDVLTYLIKVTNNGPAAANSYVLLDEVPAGLTFDPSTSGCTLVGTTVTCPSTAIMYKGGVKSFALKFKTDSATCDANITNVATVSSPNDTNMENNTSNTVSTTVNCATTDLSVVKTATSSVLQGTDITYMITAKNLGPSTSPETTVADFLPAGVNVISAPGCHVYGVLDDLTTRKFMRCPVGQLAPGQSRLFTVKVGTAAVACNTSISNTANIAGKILDSNMANNTSTAVTQVTCPFTTENELIITQKAMATTDTAVANQKDINLLRFEAHADNEDITFTKAAFVAQVGNLFDFQNYTLWVDTDGDGVVDQIFTQDADISSNSEISDNLLSFGLCNCAEFVIPAGQSVVFEVHADVASSFTNSSFQLRFATSLPAGYIEAEKVTNTTLHGIKTDGVCATTCEITVMTQQATVYTLHSQGNLFITSSSTPVREMQILGGTLSAPMMRMQLRAEHEDIDVTHLEFIGAGITQSVERLELFTVGEVTPFATATVGACNRLQAFNNTYCVTMNSQQLIILKNQTKNVTVHARIKSDTDGGFSGDQFFFYALNGSVIDQFGQQFQPEARGVVSSNSLSINDEDGNNNEGEIIFDDIRSPLQTVVMSKIISITSNDPNVDGSPIPTGSQRSIGQFKFSAAAANNTKNGSNKFVLSDIMFNVISDNVAMGSGSYKMYNKADPTNKASCLLTSVVGSQLLVQCGGLTFSSVNTEIEPGWDSTFVLEANVLNHKVSNALPSTLQVSLQNFDSISATTFGAAGSHIRWLDKDFGSSAEFFGVEYPDSVINGTTYQN